MNKKSIIIVENHPIFRKGLEAIIEGEKDLEVVAATGNFEKALALVDELAPDLVLVDLILNDANGIELIKIIKDKHPKIFLMVVTAHDDFIYVERSLKFGANGYLLKDDSSEFLIPAIRTIFSGDIYLNEQLKSKVIQKLISNKPTETFSVDVLSDRELEVFRLLGNGRTVDDISEALGISKKTVETYRARIKEKLKIKKSAELLQEAFRWVQSKSVK